MKIKKIQHKIQRLFDNKMFFGFFILLVTFIWAEQCSISLFSREYPEIDSSIFRYVAYAMKNGQIPYKDVFDHKGPLIYLINYLGLRIHPEIGVWLFEFAALFITVLFIYKIANLTCKNSIQCAATVFIVTSLLKWLQGGNLAEEYAMPLIAVAIYIFADYFRKGNTTAINLIICGLCGGGVLMLRPNMAAAWLVFPVFVIINEWKQQKYFRLIRYCIVFLLGVAIAVLPFIIYFSFVGALTDFWNVYIVFNLEYSKSMGSIVSIAKTLYSFMTATIIFTVTISFVLLFTEKTFRLFHFANFIFISLSLILLSMSGRDYGHYGMILIPACAFPIGCLLSKYKDEWFCQATVCALLVNALITGWSYPLGGCIENVWQGITKQTKDPIAGVVNYIEENTTTEDKIIVVGNANIIYLQSNRLAASKYSYQLPIATIRTDIYDEFYYELEKNNPKVVVMKKEIAGIDDFLKDHNYVRTYTDKKYMAYMQATDMNQ